MNSNTTGVQTICLLWSPPEICAAVSEAIGDAGTIETCSVLADLFPLARHPAAVTFIAGADTAAALDRLEAFHAALPGFPVITLVNDDFESFHGRIGEGIPACFVPLRPALDPGTLRGALKLISGSSWGIGSLISSPHQSLFIEIGGSSSKEAVIGCTLRFFRNFAVRGLVLEAVAAVVDEMVTNAFYDAPVDARGEGVFRAFDRRIPVVTRGAQPPAITLAWDGERAAVSMRDCFGSLDGRTVMRALKRGFAGGEQQVQHGPGGAGLGLFTIYSSVCGFWVEIDPGRSTQLITVLESGRGCRARADRPRTLVVHERPPAPEGAAAEKP